MLKGKTMTPPLHPAVAAARFYAILDTGYAAPERLPELARAALAGGAGVVQLRAKNATTAWRIQMLNTLAPICAAAGAPLVCNDDREAAQAVPGAGLHVGQDDLDARSARAALGPERVLGLSTHSLEQARAAIAMADVLTYFAVGPVFATKTKPDYAAVGLELVRAVAALRPPLPWFCIGGINRGNVAQVKAAGARAVVAVSEVLCAADPEAATRALREAMEQE
jgi:thiamine-phosphate pyrophosphorylase